MALTTGLRRKLLTVAGSLLVVGGCGISFEDGAIGPTDEPSTPVVPALSSAASPSPSGTSSVPQVVEVRYLLHLTGEEEEDGWQQFDVITDRTNRIRLKISILAAPGVPGGEEMLYTWDGSRILLFSLSNETPYTVYEAPSEHPDELQLVTSWGKPWSVPPELGCTKVEGTKTIIGRIAVGYRCVADTPEPGVPTTSEVWVDKLTGFLLENGSLVAEKLVVNPKIDATTFSTRPPANARSIVIAAKTPPPGQTKKAPDFTLELVEGGQLHSKDLAGKPYVLAFYRSDLAFDERGEVCPGCRKALLTLQSLTSNGISPTAFGVQVGDLGKPGYPLRVPGVTLPLAHEQTPVVQSRFGLVSFVFVRPDGTVAASYDGAPTDQQIRQSLAAIR